MSTSILQRRPAALDQARLAQALTISWMIVELIVAVVAGVVAHSVALVAFGVDSGIEVFTAAVVLLQLTRAAEDSSTGDASARRASRLVGFGLYGLVAYIVISSAWALLTQLRPEGSTGGVILAAAAIVVMSGLWRWRLSLARRLGSSALKADAACSVVCLYMAATLLGGLALNRLFGWWWADPLAALAMTWWIQGEGREAIEAARFGETCDCGED